MITKQQRLAGIERQIARLRARIDGLEQRSQRFSWARVVVFFGGLFLSLIAAILLAWWFGLGLLGLTVAIFSVLAYRHSKIERSIGRHSMLLYIKATHIARIRLDWQTIPPSGIVSTIDSDHSSLSTSEHPFEIDLDITGEHSLHRLLNTAISQEGRQRLRDWLLNTSPNLETIEQRQTLVRELTPMTRFRDRLTLKSLVVGSRSSEHMEGKRLLRWLDQQEPPDAMRRVFWGSLALHMLTLVLFILNLFLPMPQLWIFSMLGSLLMLFLTEKYRGDLFGDTGYLRYGFSMLSAVFEYLEHYPYRKQPRLKQLCQPFFVDKAYSPSKLLKEIARITSAATLKRNGLLWLILNALVPWDDYCAYRLRQYQQQLAQRLPGWLDAWFELEALNSLATFAYLNPEYTLPIVSLSNDCKGSTASMGLDELGEDGEHKKAASLFKASDLGHPLLPVEKKVSNDFELDNLGTVIIVTGSNMSGKSTFLRTLGINLALTYAGGPVSASQLQTQLFRLFTCIRVSDSVTEGYSYFYAEVRRLRALLTELEEPNTLPLFFLIDEIFKGTNNRERLIGSRSYVRAVVGKNCVGAISTHDLELVTLADQFPQQVLNYHFREEVVNGEMAFDYRLRPGPSPTTNALKIMRLEGLPVEDV